MPTEKSKSTEHIADTAAESVENVPGNIPEPFLASILQKPMVISLSRTLREKKAAWRRTLLWLCAFAFTLLAALVIIFYIFKMQAVNPTLLAALLITAAAFIVSSAMNTAASYRTYLKTKHKAEALEKKITALDSQEKESGISE